MPRKKIGKKRCPSCKNENSLRISRPRNSKEKLIQILTFFRIYRCKKCSWRGLKINYSFEANVIKKMVIYLLLMLMAAFIVYNLLKLVV